MATGGNNVRLVVQLIAEAAEFVNELNSAQEAADNLSKSFNDAFAQSTMAADEAAARWEPATQSISNAFDDLNKSAESSLSEVADKLDAVADKLNKVADNFGKVITRMNQSMSKFADSVATKIVKKLDEEIVDAVEKSTQSIGKFADSADEAAARWEPAIDKVGQTFEDLGARVADASKTAYDSMGTLDEAAARVGDSLSDVGEKFTGTNESLLEFVNSLESSETVLDVLPEALDEAVRQAEAAENALVGMSGALYDSVGEYVEPAIETIEEVPKTISEVWREGMDDVRKAASETFDHYDAEARKSAETVKRMWGENGEEFFKAAGGMMRTGRMVASYLARTFTIVGASIAGIFTYAVKGVEDAQFDKKVAELREAWESLRAQVGQIIIDTFGDLVPMLTEIVNKIREWIDLNPELSSQLVKIAFWVGAISLALGAILAPIARLLGIFEQLMKAGPVLTRIGKSIVTFGKWVGGAFVAIGGWFAKLGGWIMAGLAWLATFFGVTVGTMTAIVAGIIAAGVAIWYFWDEIKTFFSWLWDAIKAGADATWQWIKETASAAADGIKSAWKSLIDWLKDGWQGFKDFWSGLWDGVVSTAQKAADKVKSIWKSIKDTTSGWVDAAAESKWNPLNWFGASTLAGNPLAMSMAGGMSLNTAMLAGMTSGNVREGDTEQAEAAGDVYNFNVYQQPGEDADSLVMKISREIRSRRRR